MQINWCPSPLLYFFYEPFALWDVGLTFRLFEEALLKISLRYHKHGNDFYALVFILAPDTPHIMRLLCISLHCKWSFNCLQRKCAKEHLKALGLLWQQYSLSRGFVPLHRDGEEMRVGGSSIAEVSTEQMKPHHLVEKFRLWAFLLVALHTAGIKRCGQGRITGLLSSCLWDCIYLQASVNLCGHEGIHYPQHLYFLGIAGNSFSKIMLIIDVSFPLLLFNR